MRSPRSLRSALLVAFALAVAVALAACGNGDDGGDGGTGGGEEGLESGGFTAIGSGDLFSCALRRDGSPVCWGATGSEPAPEPDPDSIWKVVPPPEDETFTDLSVGGYNACGLREDGTAACWGIFAPLAPPEGERFASISVGSFACGLRDDGSPVCWGSDIEPPEDYEPPEGEDSPEPGYNTPEDERFIAISVGIPYACALRRDGSAVCWTGLDPWGDLGPLTPPEGERFIAVSSAGTYACGLRRDGSPVCWAAQGSDVSADWASVDNLGAWAPWEADEAASAEDGERFIAISAYTNYACALREDGSPVCWNFSGDELPPFGQTSPPLDGRFTDVSAALFHACALREDGSPVCWGSLLPHWDGGQAAPPGGDRLPPALPADERFTAISNASDYVCALREDGAPVCAGRGSYSYYAPPEGETLTAVSVSDSRACGLREDGSLVCWPNDGDAERIWNQYIADRYVESDYAGLGSRALPPPEGAFIAVSVGESQACALREDGSPVCWANSEIEEGSEAAAQVWRESGTTGRPPAGESFAAISVGEWHACGLREDGSPVCWALDDEVAADTTTTPADETFTSISSGENHACALRADGSPFCWGDDREGQASPPAGETFTAISSGGWTSCGLRADGTFTCWGGSFASSDRQTAGTEAWPAGADERYIAVSVGFQRVCAVRTDGSAVCWGGSHP